MAKEEKHTSVLFNFAMNFLLKVFGTLFAAISYPYAFRMIGGAQMGRVAFSASIASFLVMLASMGIPTYGIRECARVRSDPVRLRRVASELLALQGLSTLSALLVLLALTLAVPRLRAVWPLMLVQGVMLLFHGLDTEWLFCALERYDHLVVRSFFTKLISMLLILLCVHGPQDVLVYAGLTVLPVLLGNLWNLWVAGGRLNGLERPERGAIRRHFAVSVVFLAQAAAITVYTNLDAALLGFFTTDAVVGAYDAAVKIKLMLSFLITSLGTVLFPRFSHYLAEARREDYRRELQMSAGFIVMAALPMTVFFEIMAEACLSALYGQVLPDTLWSFRLLLPTIVIIGFSNITGIQVLTPFGGEKTVMISTVVGAAVDFVADCLLIPRYGAAGAALGTLLAEAAVLCVQVPAMRRLKVLAFPWGTFARVCALSAVAALPLMVLQRLTLSAMASVALGAFVYFGAVCGGLLVLGEPLVKSALGRLIRRQRA